MIYWQHINEDSFAQDVKKTVSYGNVRNLEV